MTLQRAKSLDGTNTSAGDDPDPWRPATPQQPSRNAFAKARATNDYDLGSRATLINDTVNSIDNYFATKATGMVGTDIAPLRLRPTC